MSAASAPKTEWLVILPDREGALETRMKVRPKHLDAINPRVQAGFWKLGGAMLATPHVEGEPLQITGSTMMAVASSREEVMEELKNDIYFREGVWDVEKIQITPFKSAFIKG